MYTVRFYTLSRAKWIFIDWLTPDTDLFLTNFNMRWIMSMVSVMRLQDEVNISS